MWGEDWGMPAFRDETGGTYADWGAGTLEILTKLSETAIASGHVVGERLGLAMAALADPEAVDHGEFTLMATEKIDGFAAAFHAITDRLWQVGHAVGGIATAQVETMTKAMADFGAAHHPLDLVVAQQRWLSDTVAAASRHAARVADGIGRLPASALDPIHSRVTDNSRRLGARGKGEEIS